MRQYATAAELAAYPDGDSIATAVADTVLVGASRIADRLLTGYVYDTDSDGLPADTSVAAILRDAVCAIAVEAQAGGLFDTGATFDWQSASIGSVSLSGRTTAQGTRLIDGWPVPPLVIAALSAVGDFRFDTLPLRRASIL